MKRLIIIAGMVAVAGVAAHAGGLADALVEAQPMVPPAADNDVMADSSGGSLPSWVVPAVLAALLIGIAVSSGDDDDGDGGPVS